MRFVRIVAAAAAGALFLSAAPGLAEARRVAEIVSVATACDALLNDPVQVHSALRDSGWRVVTPSVGGTSMATITGTEQYRKGRDNALVSGPGSMVGPNCQFDFERVSDQTHAAVAAGLQSLLGSHAEAEEQSMTWKRGEFVYHLRRRGSGGTTILWLLETKATN